MAEVNPSPLDLLRFHRLERDFYRKLIGQLNLNQERMKWVMSLWLWFESIGHHDFIRHLSSYRDDTIIAFVNEANTCLDCLVSGLGSDTDRESVELPLTAALMTEPIDLGFFDYHRNFAIVRINHFYNKVATVVFDADSPMTAESRGPPSSALHFLLRNFGEAGSSRQGADGTTVAVMPATPASAVVQTMTAVMPRLNPNAEPWSPEMNQSPEDLRSMFITFSRGYPLTREEITDFFNARYGQCVEMVMIERATGGSPPMYGRVVFTSASMIAVVLNGQQTAKFVIRGKHLWARIYVPRQH